MNQKHFLFHSYDTQPLFFELRFICLEGSDKPTTKNVESADSFEGITKAQSFEDMKKEIEEEIRDLEKKVGDTNLEKRAFENIVTEIRNTLNIVTEGQNTIDNNRLEQLKNATVRTLQKISAIINKKTDNGLGEYEDIREKLQEAKQNTQAVLKEAGIDIDPQKNPDLYLAIQNYVLEFPDQTDKESLKKQIPKMMKGLANVSQLRETEPSQEMIDLTAQTIKNALFPKEGSEFKELKNTNAIDTIANNYAYSIANKYNIEKRPEAKMVSGATYEVIIKDGDKDVTGPVLEKIRQSAKQDRGDISLEQHLINISSKEKKDVEQTRKMLKTIDEMESTGGMGLQDTIDDLSKQKPEDLLNRFMELVKAFMNGVRDPAMLLGILRGETLEGMEEKNKKAVDRYLAQFKTEEALLEVVEKPKEHAQKMSEAMQPQQKTKEDSSDKLTKKFMTFLAGDELVGRLTAGAGRKLGKIHAQRSPEQLAKGFTETETKASFADNENTLQKELASKIQNPELKKEIRFEVHKYEDNTGYLIARVGKDKTYTFESGKITVQQREGKEWKQLDPITNLSRSWDDIFLGKNEEKKTEEKKEEPKKEEKADDSEVKKTPIKNKDETPQNGNPQKPEDGSNSSNQETSSSQEPKLPENNSVPSEVIREVQELKTYMNIKLIDVNAGKEALRAGLQLLKECKQYRVMNTYYPKMTAENLDGFMHFAKMALDNDNKYSALKNILNQPTQTILEQRESQKENIKKEINGYINENLQPYFDYNHSVENLQKGLKALKEIRTEFNATQLNKQSIKEFVNIVLQKEDLHPIIEGRVLSDYLRTFTKDQIDQNEVQKAVQLYTQLHGYKKGESLTALFMGGAEDIIIRENGKVEIGKNGKK